MCDDFGVFVCGYVFFGLGGGGLIMMFELMFGLFDGWLIDVVDVLFFDFVMLCFGVVFVGFMMFLSEWMFDVVLFLLLFVVVE